MATSKLIQADDLTEQSYKMDGFDPATETVKYSTTSARVTKPVYNKYNTANKPKVFGYYTDWSQYDGRLQSGGSTGIEARGRGYDLANVSPTAYDKIILGFLGIVGDQGEKQQTVANAAQQANKKENEVTFLDPWGDFASSTNCGLDNPGWVELSLSSLTQANAKGVVGGLRDLQKKAKAQGHNLVLSLSIGGWTLSNGFHNMAKTAAGRSAFAKSTAGLFKRFPMFSEVDLDWEYPNNIGNNNPHGPEDGANYALLIAELTKEFAAINRKDIKISIACSAVPSTLEHSNIKGLLAAGLYGLNVMTYDFFGTPWAETLAHHTNLHALEKDGWGVDTAVDYLISQGVSRDRINVGYAAYTRNGQNTEIESFSPLKGSYKPTEGEKTTGTFESGTTEWYDLINNYIDLENQKGRNGFNVYTDQVADADYLYNPQSKLFLSCETPRSVKAKGEYVAEKGLGGLFTWTIDQDNGVLVNAAREGLGCSISKKVIDMSPFYFEGINVSGTVPDEPAAEEEEAGAENRAPVAAIDLQVVGGSKVRLSGAGSHDPDDDEISYLWTVPAAIAVADKTASSLEFTVPDVVSEASFTFSLAVTDSKNASSTLETFVLTVIAASEEDYADEEHEEEEEPAGTPEEPEEPEEPAAPAGDTPHPLWEKAKIYTGGETVSWKGTNYQASWWTQGDEPGTEQGTGAGRPWVAKGTY